MNNLIFQNYSKEVMPHIDELIYYAEVIASGKDLADLLEMLVKVKNQYQDYLSNRDPLHKFVLSKEELE